MTTTAEKVVTEVEKAAPEKRKALGRGLESLLPGGPRVVVAGEHEFTWSGCSASRGRGARATRACAVRCGGADFD